MAQATYNEERTPQLSLLAAAQSVGIIFGPLIQSALTAVGCEDHEGDDRYFTIDTYTLARYLSLNLRARKIFAEHLSIILSTFFHVIPLIVSLS